MIESSVRCRPCEIEVETRHNTYVAFSHRIMFIEGPADRLLNAEFSLGHDLALSAARAIRRPQDQLPSSNQNRTYDSSSEKKNVPYVSVDAEKQVKGRL